MTLFSFNLAFCSNVTCLQGLPSKTTDTPHSLKSCIDISFCVCAMVSSIWNYMSLCLLFCLSPLLKCKLHEKKMSAKLHSSHTLVK